MYYQSLALLGAQHFSLHLCTQKLQWTSDCLCREPHLYLQVMATFSSFTSVFLISQSSPEMHTQQMWYMNLAKTSCSIGFD